jgi:capsular exopolysaccharide synthesis family protein
VANLGVVLAMAGRKVSLVSADLRRPRLQEFFGTEGRRGLSDILTGGAKLGDVLQEITLATLPWAHVPRIRLRILPSGPILQDPAELLASEKMTNILRELEETSDIVLIDVPPFLPVTDALAVASVADGVILVLGPKGLTQSSLLSARQQLDKVEALMLGTVLNRPEPFISETDYSY